MQSSSERPRGRPRGSKSQTTHKTTGISKKKDKTKHKKKISSGSKTDRRVDDDTPHLIPLTKDDPEITKLNNTVVDDKTPGESLVRMCNDSMKFLKDHGIKISTITLNCTLGVCVDLGKFSKYVVLDENAIVNVKFGDRKNPATNRTIVRNLTTKQSKKNFFNQVTLMIKPGKGKVNKYINVKVFNNGSLHLTGCKDIEDFTYVVNILIKILLRGTYAKDFSSGTGVLKKIKFVDDKAYKKIGIYDEKIRLINSNFKIEYKIDRKRLDALLKKHHNIRTTDTEIGYVDRTHRSNGGHACTNIKYHYDENNKPSIFVFQTGSIIITGAKTLYQIISAYHYIKLILKKYENQIKVVPLSTAQVREAAKDFYKMKYIREKDAYLSAISSASNETEAHILSETLPKPEKNMPIIKTSLRKTKTRDAKKKARTTKSKKSKSSTKTPKKGVKKSTKKSDKKKVKKQVPPTNKLTVVQLMKEKK